MTTKIRVIQQFEGSCLGDWRVEESTVGSKLVAQLYQEPLVQVDGKTHDYSIHFVFGIQNISDHVVTIEALVSDGQAPLRSPFTTELYGSIHPTVEFGALGSILQTDGHKWHSFTLQLQPGQLIYVSNTLWRPYAYLTSLFDRLAEQAGFERFIYGKTIEERELVAYQAPSNELHNTMRPTVLVTSGMHPMEPDTLGTEAILEQFMDASHPLRNECNIVIAPILNPDGFIHGYNGCNYAGINMLWDFQYTNSTQCPEAVALWSLMKKIRPWVYIDYHSYTFHRHLKVAGPYFKPSMFYLGRAAQECAMEIACELNRIPNTQPLYPYAPSASFYKVTKEFNSVTVAKYHLHLNRGKSGCKELGWEVFERVCYVLGRQQLSNEEFLRQPYGQQYEHVHHKFQRWFYFMRRQLNVAERRVKEKVKVSFKAFSPSPHRVNE